jgi:hypothetical protein
MFLRVPGPVACRGARRRPPGRTPEPSPDRVPRHRPGERAGDTAPRRAAMIRSVSRE